MVTVEFFSSYGTSWTRPWMSLETIYFLPTRFIHLFIYAIFKRFFLFYTIHTLVHLYFILSRFVYLHVQLSLLQAIISFLSWSLDLFIYTSVNDLFSSYRPWLVPLWMPLWTIYSLPIRLYLSWYLICLNASINTYIDFKRFFLFYTIHTLVYLYF